MKLNWQGQCLRSARCLPRRQGFTSSQYKLDSKPTTIGSEAFAKTQARFERINSRLPKILRRYTTPLLHAPLSHISAFLLLHELTAVVPLLGLAGTFHYTQWMPSIVGQWKWAADGAEKFSKYFKKKGWLADTKGSAEEHKPRFGVKNRSRIVFEYVDKAYWLFVANQALQVCGSICYYQGPAAITTHAKRLVHTLVCTSRHHSREKSFPKSVPETEDESLKSTLHFRLYSSRRR